MVKSGGGEIKLDAKTYKLKETLILESNIDIVGQGSDTVITWDDSLEGSVNEPLFHRSRSGDGISNVGIKNLHLRCTVDTTDTSDRDRNDHMGLFIDGVGGADDESSLQHQNITMENLEVSSCGGTGIHIKGANYVTAIDLHLHDNGWAPIDLYHNIYLLRVRNVVMKQTSASSGGYFDSPSGHGLRMGSLENVYFENLRVEGNADHGIHMNDLNKVRGHNLTVEGNCSDHLGTCERIACYGECDDTDLEAAKQ